MKNLFIAIWVSIVAVAAASAAEPVRPMFGMKVAYLHKFYHGVRNNGSVTDLNCWGLDGGESGIRFGLTVEPRFGRVVSLSTGVFYEYFMSQNHITRWKAHEHLLYIPAHAKCSLPVRRDLSVYVLAGPALNWGMNIKLSHGSDDDIEPHFGKMGWPRRVQILGEGGVGVAWRKVALEVIYGVGLLKEDSMPQGLYRHIRQQKLSVQFEVKF